ncbi:MAG: DUF481 domain-containing protein [Pseudomonadales bacterium]|nr:DUF481 domain-containing protein [Pseudomonadales bacterium]MCP5358006.1 DUF481 domain-containing protein [Pseudomonadales bacterium]
MPRMPRIFPLAALCLFASVGAQSAFAQESDDSLSTEIELGAIFTSGNTEDENVKFKGNVVWIRDAWEYGFSIDGFRSSKQNVLAAQRVYTVGSATYNLNEDSFILSRIAHEDDRFSGYDGQSDFSVSYGQNLLRDRENLDWNYTIGAGMRYSQAPTENTKEGIIRLATELRWNVSDNALFIQTLSVESGKESSIGRSESSIQSDIMENLSMKFSIKMKHQTEVPLGRKKTDSEASVTLLLRL